MSLQMWLILIVAALVVSAISPMVGVLAAAGIVFCVCRPDIVAKFTGKK